MCVNGSLSRKARPTVLTPGALFASFHTSHAPWSFYTTVKNPDNYTVGKGFQKGRLPKWAIKDLTGGLFATYLCGIVGRSMHICTIDCVCCSQNFFVCRSPVIGSFTMYWPHSNPGRDRRWKDGESRWRTSQSMLCHLWTSWWHRTVIQAELKCKLRDHGYARIWFWYLHSYPNHPCQKYWPRERVLYSSPKWFHEEMMQSHSSPGRRLVSKTMQIPCQKVSWYPAAAADNDAAPTSHPLNSELVKLSPGIITTQLWDVGRSNAGVGGLHTCPRCQNQRKLQSGCNTATLHWVQHWLLQYLVQHFWLHSPGWSTLHASTELMIFTNDDISKEKYWQMTM